MKRKIDNTVAHGYSYPWAKPATIAYTIYEDWNIRTLAFEIGTYPELNSEGFITGKFVLLLSITDHW